MNVLCEDFFNIVPAMKKNCFFFVFDNVFKPYLQKKEKVIELIDDYSSENIFLQ